MRLLLLSSALTIYNNNIIIIIIIRIIIIIINVNKHGFKKERYLIRQDSAMYKLSIKVQDKTNQSYRNK